MERLLFMNFGTSELLLILFVILLLFGGNKLPELARGLGRGIREFKDASEGIKREMHEGGKANELKDEAETKKEGPSNKA